MGLDNLEKVLSQTLKELKDEGRLKGKEKKAQDISLKEKTSRNLSE
jgi:DNA-binding HxlR family transcriptional regulator